MRIFFFIISLMLSFSALATEEGKGYEDFPPLVNEAEQKLNEVLEEHKQKIADFVKEYSSSEEKKEEINAKITRLFLQLKSAYEDLKAEPEKTLRQAGITDEKIIQYAKEFFADTDKKSDWVENGNIKARIISCGNINAKGEILNGIQVYLAKESFILKDLNTPNIKTDKNINIKNINNFSLFPTYFTNNNYQITGYDDYFILPFTIKIFDINKPIHIQTSLEGSLCKKDSLLTCNQVKLNLSKDILITNRFPSKKCEVIKDALQRSLPKDSLTLEPVTLTDDGLLRFVLKGKNSWKDPKLSIYSEDGIKFEPPLISGADEYTILYVKPIASTIPASGLLGKKFKVIAGTSFSFIEKEIILQPETSQKILKTENTSLIYSFFAGVLLCLFSPLLMYLIFLIFYAKRVDFYKAGLGVAFTIMAIFPLLSSLIGSWGEQFLNPSMVFLAIAIILLSVLAFFRLPNVKGYSIVFTLLVFISPTNFMADAVNHNSLLGFIVMAMGALSVFILASFVKKPLRLQPISYKLCFLIIKIVALTLMLIIWFELESLYQFALIFFVFLCLIYSVDKAILKQDNKFYLSALSLIVIGVLILPHKNYEAENTLSKQIITDLLKENKMVYVRSDAPWCISCQVGAYLIKINPFFANSFKNAEIKELTATPNNQVIIEIAQNLNFGETLPLNVVFTQKAKEGVLLPTFLLDYQTKKYINQLK